jgi:uncharacterized protein (TIGR00730 family)
MRVAVFCASSERIAGGHVDLATELGTALARRGHDLVSGGGRLSCMGAVARAVRAGGRHTIGVIPEALCDLEVMDVDADELVVVPDMRARKARMDGLADGFVVLPGGIGTLEELLEIWVARSLGMHDRPVVVLDPAGVFADLRRLVDRLLAEGFVRRSALAALAWAGSVDEALEIVETPAAPVRPSREEWLEAEP